MMLYARNLVNSNTYLIELSRVARQTTRRLSFALDPKTKHAPISQPSIVWSTGPVDHSSRGCTHLRRRRRRPGRWRPSPEWRTAAAAPLAGWSSAADWPPARHRSRAPWSPGWASSTRGRAGPQPAWSASGRASSAGPRSGTVCHCSYTAPVGGGEMVSYSHQNRWYRCWYYLHFNSASMLWSKAYSNE